jgi:hypothetical protein
MVHAPRPGQCPHECEAGAAKVVPGGLADGGRAGGLPVHHLDHDSRRARLAATLGGLGDDVSGLDAAGDLDLRTGVREGVGDQLADEEYGGVDELGAPGQSGGRRSALFGEDSAYELARRGGGELVCRQAHP